MNFGIFGIPGEYSTVFADGVYLYGHFYMRSREWGDWRYVPSSRLLRSKLR